MTTSKKPEELTKGSSKSAPELKESDLDKVTGGATSTLKLGDIKGESTDDKHGGTIEILSFSSH